MTHLYRCTLELHDSLYFATREIGRLYETEPILHNYALCYALGLVDSDRHSTTVLEEHSYRYFCLEQVPKYEEHLTALNQQGIYVTPARAVHHTAVLSTWKYANNNYTLRWKRLRKIFLALAGQKRLLQRVSLSVSSSPKSTLLCQSGYGWVNG